MNCPLRIGLAAAILTISACASVPMAPKAWDLTAKGFPSPPLDRAHVYIYRNEFAGAAIKMELRLDGYPAGTTVSKTFTLLPVRPGNHVLTSEAENTAQLSFYAAPGATIFVWQEVKMGILLARSKLQLMSPEKGRAGVLECDLIAAPPPPVPPLPPPPVLPPPPPAPPGSPASSSIPVPREAVSGRVQAMI
jgi:hypothetical protein